MDSKKVITFEFMKNLILALLALNCLVMALLFFSVATMKPKIVQKPVYLKQQVIQQEKVRPKLSTQAITTLRIVEPQYTKTTVRVIE